MEINDQETGIGLVRTRCYQDIDQSLSQEDECIVCDL